MKKKYKIRYQGVILFFIVFLCFIGIIYSTINIVVWKLDNNKTEKEINELEKLVIINEIDNPNMVEKNKVENEIIEEKEPVVEIPKFDPYWDYIKMSLIDVNFSELKKINNEIVGWLKVEGTNINYPFVQTKDNSYYLTHSFNKEKNRSGWAFLDYRNNKDEYDKNTIIYGHNLHSGAIFGTLKNILNKSWQNNTNNHVIKISTEKENTLWQVFSIYTIPNTSDYLDISFNSDEEFISFVEMITERSLYKFNTTVSKDDKILTLSSCYKNSDNKLVLHAKLIKKQSK